jgi:hypothetical protein
VGQRRSLLFDPLRAMQVVATLGVLIHFFLRWKCRPGCHLAFSEPLLKSERQFAARQAIGRGARARYD